MYYNTGNIVQITGRMNEAKSDKDDDKSILLMVLPAQNLSSASAFVT